MQNHCLLQLIKQTYVMIFKILEKISENFKVIPSSAETELLLKKATKAELINYIPGDDNFSGKENNSVV